MMNKKELIAKLEKLPFEENGYDRYREVDVDNVIYLVEQLDESVKPIIPQFVADYIEWSKLKYDVSTLFIRYVFMQNKKLSKWMEQIENCEILVQAWVNGYTVEYEAD